MLEKILGFRLRFVLSVFLFLTTVSLNAQETPSLESDAGSVVAKLKEDSDSMSREKLKRILLFGTTDEFESQSAIMELNELDKDVELQLPILRLMKALAINNSTPEVSRELAVLKLSHLLWHAETVREKAKAALNEVNKATNGRYAKQIQEAFESLPRVLKFKKLYDSKFEFFAHAKEELLSHPKNQSTKQRIQTLHQQIKDALALIKENKDDEFIQTFYDPHRFVDGAESANENACDFIKNIMWGMGKSRIQQDFERQLSNGLVWTLEGRMAWAEKKNPNERRPFGVWVFRDGRWFYGLTRDILYDFKSSTGKPVDFFANSESFPLISISGFKGNQERLRSLRSTQRQSLELAQKGSLFEIYQFVLLPTIFGNLAVNSRKNLSLDAIIESFCNAPEKERSLLLSTLEKEITSQLEREPTWYLDGRVATYKTTEDSGLRSRFVVWEFFEGRWRLQMY